MKKKIFIRLLSFALCLIVLLGSTGCSLFGGKEETDGDVSAISLISSIASSEIRNNLIPLDADFNILTTKNVAADVLKQMIKTEPEIDFSIEKVSSKNYKLTPAEPLEDSSLFRIKAVTGSKTAYEWASQTDGSLRILDYSPSQRADATEGVAIKLSCYDVTNFPECFSISPEVEGKCVHNGKSWIFIPDNDLNEGEYTVTVSGDLSTSTGKTLGNDFSFSFLVSDKSHYFETLYSYNSSNDSFSEGERPRVSFRASSPDSIDAEVFSISDELFSGILEDESYDKRFSCINTIKKGTSVDTFTVKADEIKTRGFADVSNVDYLEYPRSYPAGKYIARFTDEFGVTDYQLFQVSDFSVYALSITGSVNVWVNSVKTGKPVSGCNVTLGTTSLKTDKNGIASFDGKACRKGLLKVENGSQDTFYTHLSSRSSYNGRYDYYTDLYLSSTLYAPGDTVNVFGCVMPRYGKKAPDKVLLDCEDRGFVEVTPDKNGCFTYSYVTQLPPDDWGNIELCIENDHNIDYCNSAYYSVSTYLLPSSSLTIETDKIAYSLEDSIDITVTATAFDGTPQKDLPLRIEFLGINSYDATDEDGVLKLHFDRIADEFDFDMYEDYYGSVDTFCVEASVDVADEDPDSTFSDTLIIAYSDYFAEATINRNNVMTVKTYEVDMSKLHSLSESEITYDYYGISPDLYRGKPVDKDFGISSEEIYEVKKEKDVYYDYILNKTVREYQTETEKRNLYSGAASTQNGTFSFDFTPYIKHDGRIDIDLLFKCGDYSYKEFVYNERFSYLYGYTSLNASTGYSIDTGNSDKYNVGDTVNAKIIDKKGNEPEVTSALFITAAPDRREIFTCDTADVSFEFNKNYKDLAVLYAAFVIDGKVLACDSVTLKSEFDFNLAVNAIADKESYRPGDKVTLDISVTDTDGNPVSCGGVTNVVDEALFAISYNDPSVDEYDLSDYSYIYISTWLPTPPADETGGGGGDGAPRHNFEDAPFFGIFETGSDGKATVTFTLPDSVTSWHTTVRAIDSEGRNGYIELSIVSTLDFYLYTLGSDSFKEKDDVVISAKGMSKVLSSTETGSFSAVLLDREGRELTETQTAETALNETVSFNFGKQPQGDYKIRVSAESNGYKDAVEKEIKVVASELTADVVSERPLGKNTSLDIDAPYRSGIRLVDAQYAEYQSIIDKLFSFSGSEPEMRIARKFAETWLSKGFNSDNIPRELNTDYWGFGKDVEYLAKHSFVFPYTNVKNDYSVYEEVVDSFDSFISDDTASTLTRPEKIMYLVYLASANEPVLSMLEIYNNKFDSLTDEEKTWLGLAYASAGDFGKANEIYGKLLQLPNFESDSLVYKSGDLYQEEYLTSLISMLAFRLNAPESNRFMDYLINHEFKRYLPAFALISYILNYIGDDPVTDRVTVNCGGRKEKIEFLSTESYFLSLSPEEIKNAVFTCDDCEVTAVCNYRSSVNTAVTEQNRASDIEVDMPETIQKGEWFDVKIYVYASDDKECCDLNLILPAGIKTEGNFDYNRDDNDDIYVGGHALPDNRTVSMYLYGSTVYEINLRCLASVAGNFTMEKMIATECSNRDIHVSEEKTITVTDRA
ncbi:MAG: hypothetical protein IKH65_05820 [Clostridia bacterium]|nr:hypothetical protein [Clostridia bacterium]